MDEKLYTEKEILKIIGQESTSYNLGYKILIPKAKKAGLIIELANEPKRGRRCYYKILQDETILPNEIWVTNIYNSDYKVSNFGRVKNKFGHLLGFEDGKGYIKCHINTDNNYGQQIPLHRQIYFSFNPQLFEHEKEIIIDHINGKRSDNSLQNLRPLSSLENAQAREENQTPVKYLTSQLILKYGYDKTIELLNNLLKE